MIRKWAAAAAIGVIGALALAGTAQAQDPHYPDAGWLVQDYDAGWVAASASTIVDASTVELTKPSGDVGTSIETADLGIEVATGDTISVTYELSDEVSADTGAIRMFYYDTADADTSGAAPTVTAIADGTGALALTVESDGEVGTFGLAYDASNDSAGTVRWSELEVAGQPVSFVAPETEPDPTDSEPLTVDVTVGDDCGAQVTYTNPNDFAFWGDYRLGDDQGMADSEFPALPDDPASYGDAHDHGVTPGQELTDGEYAGDEFGMQYNPALIPAGETVKVDVEADEATEIEARIWRGVNQSVYVPWTDAAEVEACKGPKPGPSETTDPGAGGGELPETSGLSAPVKLGGGAVALGGVGGLALWLGRKRRPVTGLPE